MPRKVKKLINSEDFYGDYFFAQLVFIFKGLDLLRGIIPYGFC